MPQLLEIYHTGEFWRGAAFPIGKVGDPVVIVEDIDEVFYSVLQILNTRKGERIMYPEFGSNLGPILWEPHDDFLRQLVSSELTRSLSLWEPRVRVGSIAFDLSTRLIDLGIFVLSISISLINNPGGIDVIQVPLSSQGTLFG
jgi:phage baseplate assembly protein W